MPARVTLPRIDPFIAAMLLMVAIGLFAPQVGASDGPLRLGALMPFGIALLFFLHGANLSTDALIGGAKAWRLHALVQGATFIVFPFVGFALVAMLKGQLPLPLIVGLFFLCALPSTIASSIAMTGIARGNVAAAIFNATLSALIGMVATPLLVRAGVSGTDIVLPPLIESLSKIGTLLLLPFLAGQVARPLIAPLLVRHKRLLYIVDRGIILLIILAAFADATKADVWHQVPPAALIAVGGVTIALLAAALIALDRAARALALPQADRIAALFCGSQKSLANGVPMALAIFGPGAALGLILLPLLLYQQAQLIVAAVIARRFAESEA